MYKEDRFTRHKNRLETYAWICGLVAVVFIGIFLMTNRPRYLLIATPPILVIIWIKKKIDKDEKSMEEGEWKPKKRIKKQQHENNPNK